MINNITEILAYSVLHQNIEIIENLEKGFDRIQEELLLVIKGQEELKYDVSQIKNLILNGPSSYTSSSSSIIQSMILAKPKDSSESSRFTKPLF